MKKIYYSYTLAYLIVYIIELINYLGYSSNTFGLWYMILSSIILFFLILTSINYDKSIKNIRISKNIFLIFIMLFCTLLLPKFTYIDSSNSFIETNKIFIYYIKNSLTFVLALTSIFDFKFKTKS